MAAVSLFAGCGGGGDGAETTASAPPAPKPSDDGQDKQRLPAGDGQGGVRLRKVGDFDQPLYIVQPPGYDRDLFVVEKTGQVQVVHDGERLPEPFLDLSDAVSTGGEQGLLSVTFAPDYQSSGLLYVDYTDTAGDTRVVEYRRSAQDPLVADPQSAREVLTVDQPYENHNGGLVLFGPGETPKGSEASELLYVGLGDGGSADDPERNGQDLSTLLGKILRIDPRPSGGRPYGIPQSNPFVDRSGARGEIYSYGLRNPWRFSFDRRTGDLSIGDVGQNEIEEIDFVRRGKGRGANFGWRPFEGNDRFAPGESAPGAIKPVITAKHSDGNCSITGGVVIRDPALGAWRGRYVFGDFCRGVIQTAVLSAGRAKRLTDRKLTVSQLSSFGEDARGRVYATSLDGPVYRFVQ